MASYDVDALLPKHIDRYYHRLASSNMPPLTENVEWYVIAGPAEFPLPIFDWAFYVIVVTHGGKFANLAAPLTR